ncbi:MAG: hypothetical protein NWE93_14850 [Candidatus Bathyarchaeota archaeon]|nr:hypothetical protein [Candidatus Bathyarchaeota archaeon]
MKSNNKSKTISTILISLATIVIITLALYFASAQTLNYPEIISLTIIALIVIFAIYTLYDKTKSLKQGLTAADERTKTVNYRAGYYGFIAAIWSAVFTPIVVDIIFNYEMETDYLSGSVVIIGGLVFALSYLYLSRKGR